MDTGTYAIDLIVWILTLEIKLKLAIIDQFLYSAVSKVLAKLIIPIYLIDFANLPDNLASYHPVQCHRTVS